MSSTRENDTKAGLKMGDALDHATIAIKVLNESTGLQFERDHASVIALVDEMTAYCAAEQKAISQQHVKDAMNSFVKEKMLSGKGMEEGGVGRKGDDTVSFASSFEEPTSSSSRAQSVCTNFVDREEYEDESYFDGGADDGILQDVAVGKWLVLTAPVLH
ncbi:MAG: hypothetical protein M4579_003981 [Chaenotheca gracillima]|nr:MAG: hypothetical protein M4579_003981 [Chaenotheca gracillima]